LEVSVQFTEHFAKRPIKLSKDDEATALNLERVHQHFEEELQKLHRMIEQVNNAIPSEEA
jgi:hypothetical protein